MDCITGQIMGVKRMSKEFVSMNVPRIIRRITTRVVITNLLLLIYLHLFDGNTKKLLKVAKCTFSQ